MALVSHAQEVQRLGAQVVAQQARCDVGVVGLLLDHGARGDHQRCAQLVCRDTVVQVLQGLVEDAGFADIGQVRAGFADDGVQAIQVQGRPAAVRLHDVDVAGGRLGGGRQGLLGSALACLLLAVDDVVAGDLVFAGSHQRQFDLVLYVLDVDGATGGHATLEGGGDLLGQLGHGFVDAAGRGRGAAFNGEECLGDGHGDLARLKGHDGAVTLDDAQLARRSRGYFAAQ